MSAFYENFIKLCADANVSPSAAANAIGLSGAAASGWKKGAMPSDATLQKLANYFEVNKDALTGEKEKPIENDGLSDAKKKLLKETADLSPAEMALLLEKLQQIKDMRMK